MLDPKQFEVVNVGISGATICREENYGEYFTSDPGYQQALVSQPDVAILWFGLNDGFKLNIDKIKADFTAVYVKLIKDWKSIAPKLYLVIPPPMDPQCKTKHKDRIDMINV